MRIKLVLESEGNNQISLPVHYNQIIQGFLYHNLPTELGKFLHDVGFFYHNRPFKLFTFSKIFSKKITINNSTAYFESPITIFISSPVEDVSKSFAKSLLISEKISLKNQSLTLKSIEILQKPKFDFINKIKTLFPITVYKTIEKEDGKKITQYFFPEDPEFKDLVKENIRKKYSVIKETDLNDFEFDIKPLGYKKKIIKYKNFVIKAVDGEFELKIQPEILETVYDAGIGAKNSQGFGMIKII